MTRTNLEDGHREEICLECENADTLIVVQSEYSKEDRYNCVRCGAAGSRINDVNCLYDWDARYTGSVGLRVVEDGEVRILDGQIAYSDETDDSGIPKTVKEV